MSAEVVTKKRGRPPKKVASAAPEDNVIVLETSASKTRGRSSSVSTSASASSPASVSASTSAAASSSKKSAPSPTTTPPLTPEKKTKNVLETPEDKATTTPAKRKTVKNLPGAAPASASKKTAPAAVKPESAAEQFTKGPKDQGSKAGTTSQILVSKILRQAKAFTKDSAELHQGALQFIQEREAGNGHASSQSAEHVRPSTTSIPKGPLPHPFASSSTRPKYVIPASTATALAARRINTQQQQQQQQQQHQKRLSPITSIPTQRPAQNVESTPKPSEIPLEQLKKDPKYRALSRRWTMLMVALPFAIVSSYFLWLRYEEHQAYLKARDARMRLKPRSTSGFDSTAVSTEAATRDAPGEERS